MLKIIFFDWGGVLCESMLARIERECALRWTPSRRQAILDLNTGKTSLVQAMQRVTQGTEWRDRWDDLIRITLQHLMTHRNPHVWTLAGMLRGIGLRTAILSNQSVEWACQIGALYNLQMVFQPTIFSAVDSLKVGRPLLKPESAIYRHALKVAEVKPSEAVLVDDQEENCAAAEREGMHAIRFEDPMQLKTRLEELLVAQKYPLRKATRGRPRKRAPTPPPCDCH
jgi:HAD superfamily hydrolase (TIGR01509 family)